MAAARMMAASKGVLRMIPPVLVASTVLTKLRGLPIKFG